MPPETPASRKLTPFVFACSARRMESRKFEFPPSTTVSPSSSIGSSVWNVFSVGSPDGIISQTTRGCSSFVASSTRESAVRSGAVRA